MNESRNLNFQLPSIKPTPHGTGLFRPLFENTTISLEDTGKKPTPPSSEGWKIQLLFRRHRQGLNPHKTIQGWRVFTRFLWLNDFPPPQGNPGRSSSPGPFPRNENLPVRIFRADGRFLEKIPSIRKFFPSSGNKVSSWMSGLASGTRGGERCGKFTARRQPSSHRVRKYCFLFLILDFSHKAMSI